MTADKNLIILGHRGAIMDDAPFYQNSLRAFEEAVDAADGFETDACVDKNGEVFLIHESRDIGFGPDFKGVTYNAAEHLDAASAALMGKRRIDEMTTEEMKRLRLKDSSPVPTLRQAIGIVGSKPGKILNIELKAYGVVDPVLRDVKQALRDKVITTDALLISSFNHQALEIVRRDAPELGIGAIFNYPDMPMRPMFPWQPGSSGLYMPLTDEAVGSDVLKRIQPDMFVMPEEILTEDNVAMIATRYSGAKCAAWVYTEKGDADLPGLLRRLEVLRATGKIAAVMVDNPREFMKALPR